MQKPILIAVTFLLVTAPEVYAQVETIIVTAEKRAEDIQNVPISVTAFTGDQIDRAGITGIEDIARRAPGLQYGNFSEMKLDPTALRGISASTPSAGQDPAVGYYLDEVFLGAGVGANIDYYDLDRVEVLRGPQGTLFGRNTVGGVINITTRPPPSEFEAYGEVEYGNYDYWHLTGAVGGPLVDGVLDGRLAGTLISRDGFTDNIFLHQRGNDDHHGDLRGSLLWTPLSNVQLDLTVDYRKAYEHPKLFETLKYNPDSLFYALLGAFNIPLNANPFDRKVESDLRSRESLDGWGTALRGTVTFADNLQLVSVSSYRQHNYFDIGDTDMSPLRWAYDGDPERVWRASQEVRLTSQDNPFFDWLVGLYYYRQHTSNDSFIKFGSDFSLVLTGDPNVLDGLRIGSFGVLDEESYAMFASGTVKISKQLDFTVGGRYTYEQKSVDYNQSDPLALLGGDITIKAHDNWRAFTPSFTGRYFISDGVMLFATASKGFKSGGFNDGLGVADGLSFGPEYLWNYEAGIKSSWLQNRLLVNASLFRMNWTDIQLSADDPNTPVFDPRISNAGKAHSQGLDLDITAAPTDQLTFGGNLEILDAKFDEGVIPTAAGQPGIPLRRMVRAPNYQFNVNGEYRIPLGWSELRLSAEWLENGPMYLTLDNQADGRVRAYGLLNARIALDDMDGWRVSVWGNNLTNKTYMTRLFDLYSQDLIGQKLIELGQPRTVGIEVHKALP